MKTIDVNEVKRLNRIIAGKEPVPSKHSKRLHEVQMQMAGKDILKDLQELRDFDETPGISKSFLFFFNGKYLFVKGKLTKIKEKDVERLTANRDTKIYFLCSRTVCPMPKVLTDKDKEAVKVADDQAAAAFITEKTGVSVNVNDL